MNRRVARRKPFLLGGGLLLAVAAPQWIAAQAPKE